MFQNSTKDNDAEGKERAMKKVNKMRQNDGGFYMEPTGQDHPPQQSVSLLLEGDGVYLMSAADEHGNVAHIRLTHKELGNLATSLKVSYYSLYSNSPKHRKRRK